MTLADFVKRFTQIYELSRQELLSTSRKQPLAYYRQLCYWSAWRAGWNYSEIAWFFDRDHKTVIHGIDKVISFEGGKRPKKTRRVSPKTGKADLQIRQDWAKIERRGKGREPSTAPNHSEPFEEVRSHG